MPHDLLLALEGGGTRSQAALLDAKRGGRVVHVVDSADVNTNFTALQASQQAVLAAVTSVLRGAQISGDRVTCCVSALVGPPFSAELLRDIIPFACYHSYSEGEVVFARAGLYHPHGVAVVAGTGATAWAVRADDTCACAQCRCGRQRVFGGWGALLGDEGSGYALGVAGLRGAVRAFEGRAEAPTHLDSAIRQHFGLSEATFREDFIRLAYQQPLSRAEIAAVAAVVARLAAQGDPLAAQLTAAVAADLAALTLYTAHSLFAPAERFDVVVAGGLTNAGELVLGPVRQRIAQEFPKAAFAVGTEAPAVALGRLAQYDQQTRHA